MKITDSEMTIESIKAESAAKLAGEYEEYKRKCVDERWERLCPFEYRKEIGPELLPSNRRWESVANWQMGPKGLFIMGPTRTGKTRASYAAIKRLHYAGHQIIALDGMAFSNEASKASKNPDETERWLNRLVLADLLFIDDLAKRTTPAFWPLFFAVVERRTSQGRPVLVTTNHTAETLMAMIGDPQMAEPLFARIREFFDVIALLP